MLSERASRSRTDGPGMKYAPLTLLRRRLLLPVLALGGLVILGSCATDGAKRHLRLGDELWNKGKEPSAIEEYQEAVRLKPNWAEAHFALGFAHGMSGHGTEAEQEFRTVIRLKPKWADAYGNLGSALSWQGKYAEAEKEYREALVLGGRKASVLQGLANTLDHLGRRKEARKYWEEALKLVKPLPKGEEGVDSYEDIKARLAEPD